MELRRWSCRDEVLRWSYGMKSPEMRLWDGAEEVESPEMRLWDGAEEVKLLG